MKTTPLIKRRTIVLLLSILLPYFLNAQSGKPIVITQTLSNYCPATAADLTTVLTGDLSPGQSIRWFNNSSHSGSHISTPSAVGNGTYYAFLFDGTQYSAASDPVTVALAGCTGLTPVTLPPNQLIPLTSAHFANNSLSANRYLGGIPANPSSFLEPSNNISNLIDSDLNNSVASSFVVLGGVYSYRVKHDGTQKFPMGSYAGFVISTESLIGLEVGASVEVQIYNNNTLVQTKSISTSVIGLSLVSSNKAQVGLISTGEFDEIRVNFTALLSTATVRAYHAVVSSYQNGPALRANLLTPINNNIFPTSINTDRSGLLNVGGAITNAQNAISPSRTDFATMSTTADVLSSSSLSVTTAQSYTAGTFAGFNLASGGLLGLDLLSAIRIRTYLNGQPVDNVTGASLLSLNPNILGGENKQIIGLISTGTFNEIQISAIGLASAAANYKIFEAVLQRFEDKALEDCNTYTTLTNPEFPMVINGARTGILTGLGLCALCDVQNAGNVINNTTADYATINLGAAVLEVNGGLSVKKQVGSFAAGTFAGFEIENTNIIDLSILNAITIRTFRNGNPVQSQTGTTQLASLNLFNSNIAGRTVVGFVPNGEFDEIMIELNNNILTASLGTTRVYRAVATEFCAPTLTCDETYTLTQPEFPTVINSSRSGITGAVCGLTSISNMSNVLNADTTDYASISVPIGVACNAAISLKSYDSVYPGGSQVGFTIETPSSILQANLLPSLTISTYLNGTEVDNVSGSSLLNLQLLGIFGGQSKYKVSFRTTGKYDEIRIEVRSLASALNEVRVYGAFINTRGSNDDILSCCAAEGHTPTLFSLEEINECPEEFVNLSSNVSNTCPFGSELQWHTAASGFGPNTLVANPSSVLAGSYYAVCYDELVGCYSNPSEELKVDVAECCPVIVLDTPGTTNPTSCGLTDGAIKICGLRPGLTGYTVEYRKDSAALTVLTGLPADSSGCITIAGLGAGEYTEIRAVHDECPEGTNELSVTLEDPERPAAPTAVAATETGICVGQSTTLSGTCIAGSTLAWYSDSTLTSALTSLTVSPNITSTYYAVCETLSCKSDAASITITVNTVPTAPTSLSATPSTICAGQSTVLAATCTTGTLQWYSDSALTVPVGVDVSPTSNASYYATCENGSCKSPSASIPITVTPVIAAPTLTATPTTINSGGSSILGGTCASGTLTWFTDDQLTISLPSTTVSPAVTTTYYANCGGTCSLSSSITVNVIQQVFDLAIELKRATGQRATVNLGDTVTFTITVHNQGNMLATDVQLTNYIPAGLNLTGANWTQTGTNATLNTVIASIAGGASHSVNITFIVDSSATGTITNAIEISAAVGGVDIDSTPDDNPLNDDLVPPNPAIGNLGGTKEDDYDEASISICPTGTCMTSQVRRVK